MQRKEFLLSLGMGAGSIIMSCCLGGCSKSGGDDGPQPGPGPNPGGKVDFTFDTGADADLSAKGWTIRNNVIIARSGNEYLAFDSRCPHQGSALTYNGTANTFPCSNTAADHGSVFDATGKKLSGPAPSDLKKYQTQLTGKNLRVFE